MDFDISEADMPAITTDDHDGRKTDDEFADAELSSLDPFLSGKGMDVSASTEGPGEEVGALGTEDLDPFPPAEAAGADPFASTGKPGTEPPLLVDPLAAEESFDPFAPSQKSPHTADVAALDPFATTSEPVVTTDGSLDSLLSPDAFQGNAQESSGDPLTSDDDFLIHGPPLVPTSEPPREDKDENVGTLISF